MPKLFILHGWTYQIETWRSLREMLAERGIEHEFLLIPGLTDDTNPVWTLDDYVKWLEEKTASYEKVILIGHSSGGRLSLAFAAKHPEKVERLILEDSAGIPPRGLRKLKRDMFRICAQTFGRIVRFEKMRSIFRKAIRASDYARATPEMRRTMSNLVGFDARTITDKIKCPTLIIWGAKDTTTPLSDGQLLHEGIRDSRMIVIPDARHSPHITHPSIVADLIAHELSSEGGSAYGGQNA